MNIYKSNKYTKFYFGIIKKASINNNKNNQYYEKHHILPKSLGGNNNQDNIVKLTIREHFVCHKLLIKMTSGKNKAKMVYALLAMCKLNYNRKEIVKLNSRNLEYIRKELSDNNIMKYMETNKGSFIKDIRYDHHLWTNERKLKSSLAKLKDKNPNFGNKEAGNHLKVKIICPNCRILFDLGNYHRWHKLKCHSSSNSSFSVL